MGPHQKELLSVSKPWEMHRFHSMLLTSTGLEVQGFFKIIIIVTIRGFLRPGLYFGPFQGPVTKTRVSFSICPKSPFFTASLHATFFKLTGASWKPMKQQAWGRGVGGCRRQRHQSELCCRERTLHPTLKFSWAFDALRLFQSYFLQSQGSFTVTFSTLSGPTFLHSVFPSHFCI